MSKTRLFLSYNSRDHAAVDFVRRELEQRGLSTFLDRLDLPPGQPWPKVLEERLSAATAVAVFLGPHGLGNWQRRELWLALDRQARAEGLGEIFPVIPVLLPSAFDPGATFLTLNTWVDLRRGLENAPALDILAGAACGLAPRDLASTTSAPPARTLCPYRSLAAFREEDSALFFGRDDESQQLLAKVRTSPLVTVVGASGSGKSSLVRAGLVPALRRERSPEASWDVVVTTPGKTPFHRLAAGLLPLLEPELSEVDRLREAEKLGASFENGEMRLGPVVDRLLAKSGGTDRLLVVLDQFEELFTQTPAEIQQRFAELLLRGTEEAMLGLVLTLRGDFFGAALSLPRQFASAVDRGQFNLLAMSREGLLAAIEKPAAAVGLSFEPGLSQVILEEVGDEPGRLPLLEFALAELWLRSQPGTKLTLSAYVGSGGVSGAIAQQAERFSATQSAAEKLSLRRLMTRLVRVSERPEAGQDTRQRLSIAELPEDIVNLLRKLADERLVVTGRDSVTGEEIAEIAHEALIREWAELRGWLDHDRAFLRYRQDLQREVERWLAHGRSDGYLLTGDRLGEGERWRGAPGKELTEAQQAFLSAGADLRSRFDAETRTRQLRLQWLLRALAAATVCLALLLGWNLVVSQNLRTHKASLSSQLLARRSQIALDENPQAAALVAREAVLKSRPMKGLPLAETETALRAALAQLGGKPVLHPKLAYERRIVDVVMGKNGRWLATETRDGTVRLSRLTAEAEVAEVHAPLGHRHVPSGPAPGSQSLLQEELRVAFSQEGAWALVRTTTGASDLFRLSDSPEKALTIPSPVATAEFSSDEQALALGLYDGRVLWVDLSLSKLLPVALDSLADTQPVRELEISADSRWLAVLQPFEPLVLCEVRPEPAASCARTVIRPGLSRGNGELLSEAPARAAAFRPDSEYLFFLAGDSLCYFRLRQPNSLSAPAICQASFGALRNFFFGKDYRLLAGAVNGGLGMARISPGTEDNLTWHRESWGQKKSLSFLGSRRDWLELQGRRGDLALTTLDQLRRTSWHRQVLSPPDFLLPGTGRPVEGLAADQPGRWLIGWSAKAGIRAWHLGANLWPSVEPAVLDTEQLAEMAFSPGGHLVGSVLGTGFGTHGHLWNQAELGSNENHTIALLSDKATELAAMSPTGGYFGLLDKSGSFRRWDLNQTPDRASSFRLEIPPGLSLHRASLSACGRWLAMDGHSADSAGSSAPPSHPQPLPAAASRPWRNTVLLWRLEAREDAISPRVYEDASWTLLDPQGTWLLVNSDTGKGFDVYDLTTFERLPEFSGRRPASGSRSADPSSVAVSPDGRWVYIGTTSEGGELWEIKPERGQLPREPAPINLRASTVAFSQDSRRLLIGTARGTAVILALPQDQLSDAQQLHLLAVTDRPITVRNVSTTLRQSG